MVISKRSLPGLTAIFPLRAAGPKRLRVLRLCNAVSTLVDALKQALLHFLKILRAAWTLPVLWRCGIGLDLRALQPALFLLRQRGSGNQ